MEMQTIGKEGDNSEIAVLESLAISSLVVESCFDSSRQGVRLPC